MRTLRRLQREQEPKSPFVFTSERGAPFSTAGFARMVERAGREAKLAFKAHPHMLRHACGYALANKGYDTRALQAYLATATFSIPSGTPSSHRRGLRISGGTKNTHRWHLSDNPTASAFVGYWSNNRQRPKKWAGWLGRQ